MSSEISEASPENLCRIANNDETLIRVIFICTLQRNSTDDTSTRIEEIANSLLTNSNLQELTFHDLQTDNMKEFNLVLRAIRSHPSLSRLEVTRNRFGTKNINTCIDELIDLINNNPVLTVIHYWGNFIGIGNLRRLVFPIWENSTINEFIIEDRQSEFDEYSEAKSIKKEIGCYLEQNKVVNSCLKFLYDFRAHNTIDAGIIKEKIKKLHQLKPCIGGFTQFWGNSEGCVRFASFGLNYRLMCRLNEIHHISEIDSLLRALLQLSDHKTHNISRHLPPSFKNRKLQNVAKEIQKKSNAIEQQLHEASSPLVTELQYFLGIHP